MLPVGTRNGHGAMSFWSPLCGQEQTSPAYSLVRPGRSSNGVLTGSAVGHGLVLRGDTRSICKCNLKNPKIHGNGSRQASFARAYHLLKTIDLGPERNSGRGSLLEFSVGLGTDLGTDASGITDMQIINRLIGQAGGAGGIRTLDRALQPYNGLANRRLQPLGHSSVKVDMPDAGASRKRQIYRCRIGGRFMPPQTPK